MEAVSLCKLSPLVLSCVAGYENLAVWSDLLDCINVFPVADGDTGANLRVSLAPLRDSRSEITKSVQCLAVSGIGNSGNIAVAFLREFLKGDGEGFVSQATKGRERAYRAIHKPLPGTMLDVFDALCLVLKQQSEEGHDFSKIRHCLQKAVLGTADRLPVLEDAGVVDSGALGMFIFFDGFFQQYIKKKAEPTPLMELFRGRLHIAPSYQAESTGEYCVEALLAVGGQKRDMTKQIAALGESAVVAEGSLGMKVHLHTGNPVRLRKELAALGDLVHWSDEAMEPTRRPRGEESFRSNRIRIISDAAASIPPILAREHGILLLDSYILAADQALPESLYSPEKLYSLMRKGHRVRTAQASASERHLHYHAACAQYEKVLYLSTGSAFTGNYSTALAWKEHAECTDNLQIIDSGAASGRLAAIVLLSARLAESGACAEDVVSYANTLCRQAEEYVFIDELKYLAAGGRISRTKGFFADLLHLKPVISPGFEGVRKMGVVRNQRAQIDFALEKLGGSGADPCRLFVLLQYSDNKEWLSEIVEPEIRSHVPGAEIVSVPLSLTSGVHMGPGTWSIAFAEKEGGVIRER